MLNLRIPFAVCLAAAPLLLAGCGGSSSSGSGSSSSGSGSINLGITDGPIDTAVSVVVQFTGVSIKPESGSAIDFTFDEPKSIDLLQLQGTQSEDLLSNVSIPAGKYQWIRLAVSAELDSVMDSYIEMVGGVTHELYVPSGSQTGLKLVNGFTVAADETTDFMIDFDLRKSITNPKGIGDGMILKPTLRLVDNLAAGSINGAIAGELVSSYL